MSAGLGTTNMPPGGDTSPGGNPGGKGIPPGGRVTPGGRGITTGGKVTPGGRGITPGGMFTPGGWGIPPGGNVTPGGRGIPPGGKFGRVVCGIPPGGNVIPGGRGTPPGVKFGPEGCGISPDVTSVGNAGWVKVGPEGCGISPDVTSVGSTGWVATDCDSAWEATVRPENPCDTAGPCGVSSPPLFTVASLLSVAISPGVTGFWVGAGGSTAAVVTWLGAGVSATGVVTAASVVAVTVEQRSILLPLNWQRMDAELTVWLTWHWTTEPYFNTNHFFWISGIALEI